MKMSLHKCRIYLKCFEKLFKVSSLHKNKEKVHINIHPQTVFKLQLNNLMTQSFRFLPVEHLKTKSIRLQSKTKRHFNAFRMLSNYSQPSFEGKQLSIIRCVHACFNSGGGHFGICCELWLNKQKELNSYKIGMCILNPLCQLQVKYYITNIFIVKCKSFKLNNNLFPDICLYELFCCDVKNSLLKFAQKFQIHPVY